MSPCKQCSAKCCRYFALQIDTPTTRNEFQNVRWYLAHNNVAIFIDDGMWFLEVFSECKYLTPDHRCKVYDNRPEVCRDHSSTNCEVDADTIDHEQHFLSMEDFDAYLKCRFKKKAKTWHLT